jgi:Domain of unknown function (DUF4410)
VFLVLLGITASYAADKLKEKLSGYNKVEVAPFRNKVGEVLEQQTITDLQARVVNSINESKLLTAAENTELKFPKKDSDDDTKVVFTGTGKDDDKTTMVLFSEIITFNKGSRAKRYLVGGGTGRAELRGNCYIVDKMTGKQIYNFQTFGETNWGLAGGGADKTLKGYASRIIDFLKGK